MSTDAHKVTLDQLREALTVMGIDSDTKTLQTVFIEPGKITVVRKRLNESGHNYVVGYQDVATEIVTMAVVDK
jgi:hypothetical protein